MRAAEESAWRAASGWSFIALFATFAPPATGCLTAKDVAGLTDRDPPTDLLCQFPYGQHASPAPVLHGYGDGFASKFLSLDQNRDKTRNSFLFLVGQQKESMAPSSIWCGVCFHAQSDKSFANTVTRHGLFIDDREWHCSRR